MEAQRKTLSHDGNAEAWSSPSLWNTKEMDEELEEARAPYVEEDDTQEHDEYGRIQGEGKRAGEYDTTKWHGACCHCEEGGKVMLCNDFPYVAHRDCVEKNG